jgi:enterochelin esterase family protein
VTTAPAVPGFHYYWFEVDGLNVNDPSSYTYFGWGRETSGIEVPEPGVDYYDKRTESSTVRCESDGITRRSLRNGVAPTFIRLQITTRTLVLVTRCSIFSMELGRTSAVGIEQGRANFILDNLLAARKAKPMIVVVDTGYAARPARVLHRNHRRGPPDQPVRLKRS